MVAMKKRGKEYEILLKNSYGNGHANKGYHCLSSKVLINSSRYSVADFDLNFKKA